MFRYTVLLSGPEIPPAEVCEFLAWDLNAEGVEAATPAGEAPRLCLRFRHPWIEAATVEARLRAEFGLGAAEVAVERRDEAAPEEPAGRAEPAPALGPEAILAVLRAEGFVDRRALVKGQGLEVVRAVDRVLAALVAQGAIEAQSRHVFRAKAETPRPDPEAQAAARRARPLEPHETLLLQALAGPEALGPGPLLAATGLSEGRLMSAAMSLEERGLAQTSGQGTRWWVQMTETGRRVAAQEDSRG